MEKEKCRYLGHCLYMMYSLKIDCMFMMFHAVLGSIQRSLIRGVHNIHIQSNILSAGNFRRDHLLPRKETNAGPAKPSTGD